MLILHESFCSRLTFHLILRHGSLLSNLIYSFFRLVMIRIVVYNFARKFFLDLFALIIFSVENGRKKVDNYGIIIVLLDRVAICYRMRLCVYVKIKPTGVLSCRMMLSYGLSYLHINIIVVYMYSQELLLTIHPLTVSTDWIHKIRSTLSSCKQNKSLVDITSCHY